MISLTFSQRFWVEIFSAYNVDWWSIIWINLCKTNLGLILVRHSNYLKPSLLSLRSFFCQLHTKARNILGKVARFLLHYSKCLKLLINICRTDNPKGSRNKHFFLLFLRLIWLDALLGSGKRFSLSQNHSVMSLESSIRPQKESSEKWSICSKQSTFVMYCLLNEKAWNWKTNKWIREKETRGKGKRRRIGSGMKEREEKWQTKEEMWYEIVSRV